MNRILLLLYIQYGQITISLFITLSVMLMGQAGRQVQVQVQGWVSC